MTDEATITTTLRLCFKCYERKPPDAFPVSALGTDNRSRECRACRSKRDRKKAEAERERVARIIPHQIDCICSLSVYEKDGTAIYATSPSCPYHGCGNQHDPYWKTSYSIAAAVHAI